MALSVTTDYTDTVGRHPPVAWRPGFALPGEFTATVSDSESPYRVELWLSVHDREVQCDSVRISRRQRGGPPVTARRARLPLDRYVREAAVCAAWKIGGRRADGRYVLEPMGGEADDRAAWETSRPARQKTRWALTDEHLKAVAEVYRANPKKPRRAVEGDSRWGPVPASTAARWVRAAKDAGLIGENDGKGGSK